MYVFNLAQSHLETRDMFVAFSIKFCRVVVLSASVRNITDSSTPSFDCVFVGVSGTVRKPTRPSEAVCDIKYFKVCLSMEKPGAVATQMRFLFCGQLSSGTTFCLPAIFWAGLSSRCSVQSFLWLNAASFRADMAREIPVDRTAWARGVTLTQQLHSFSAIWFALLVSCLTLHLSESPIIIASKSHPQRERTACVTDCS